MANDRGFAADDRRLPLLAFAALALVTLLAGLTAGLLPAGLRGSHTAYITALQPHFVDRFFQWDALWYERVARHGYDWNPRDPGHKHAIAFFPLWPAIIRILSLPASDGLAQRWLIVAGAGAVALASVFGFQRLATRILEPRTARLATLLYAFWPAAVFLLQSYPTGLLNLLTFLCLEALVAGRRARAALYSGIASAAGPLALGLAMTVCLELAITAWPQAGRARHMMRHVLRAAPLAVLSVVGLLVFVAWQQAAFGDPLAFVAAQQAWGTRRPILPRLLQFLLMSLGVPDLVKAAMSARYAVQFAAQNNLPRAATQLVSTINLIGLGAAIMLLPAMRLCVARTILVQACLTLSLYIWFAAADNGGWATLRLLYPIPGIFLALAWLLSRRARLAKGVVAGFASLLALYAFLMAAGYSVI